MKFTIITAVFNGEESIACAMKSVQRQTYNNVEHLVQDGLSEDGTLNVIRSNLSRDTKVFSEPDTGIYDALNKGIEKASGDIIGIMHADDFYAHSDVLDRVAKVFQEQEADVVYGDLQYVSRQDTEHIVRHWRAGTFRRGSLKWGWMPPHPTVFLRREVFKVVGLYDKTFTISGDYDLMLRVLTNKRFRVAYAPEVLVKMRLGGKSNKSLRYLIRKTTEDFLVVRRHQLLSLATVLVKNIRKLNQFFLRRGRIDR